MNNDFTARGDLGNGRPERDRRGASPDAPLTDREVPLGLARTPVAVHQWLDGDLPESSVRQGEMVRHVEFWNRVGAQAEARRQMRTPAHLQAQIMAALPLAAPAADTTPWYGKTIELAPVVAILGGAALVAAGAAIGAAVAR